MEYSVVWWLTHWVSILTAYTLSGFIEADLSELREKKQVPVKKGLQVYETLDHCEDSKPYNTGDPRAG